MLIHVSKRGPDSEKTSVSAGISKYTPVKK